MKGLPAQVLCEEIWLSYFNNYLYERGIIEENEKRMMERKIEKHISAKKK